MHGLSIETHDNGVIDLILDRTEVHNAFDDRLIKSLSDTFSQIADDQSIGVVCMSGRGKNFSAGADLNWMRRMADYDRQQNLDDALALADMLRRLNELPQTTVALIQGAAMGGAVGLASCCDIVIAADTARFALSEARLGIIPAVISPYVVAAIGARQSRRYMQSGERFDAQTAQRIGLVHEVVSADALTDRGDALIKELLTAAPAARRIAKQLVYNVSGRAIDETVINYTAGQIADVRASDEGREGVSAFLDKRLPNWRSE